MHYLVISQVDMRVQEDLIEDMAAFEGLLNGEIETLERFDLDLSDLRSNSDHQGLILPPANSEELQQIFRLYVTRRIPEDDTIFLTFIGSELYLSSVEARPPLLQPGSDLFRYFISRTHPTQGKQKTLDPRVGNILYYVRPIPSNHPSNHPSNRQTLGTFVALHLNAEEQQEAFDALSVVFQGMFLVLTLALGIAWLIAGQVLAPIRSLAETARTITETSLTQRIPIRGQGELADLTKTFNAMMDRVETAFVTQREFVNDASHELRTPITIIRGHLEIMEENPQEQKKNLALVMNELDRMSRFVQDLLLLAKAQHPDFLRFDLIDLQFFTKELFTKAQVIADRDWQLESIASGQLVGDRQRITQAMINLVENAAQHTIPQDTITIGSSLQKNTVQFWVRDTGSGIALKDQQHIFERFARVPHSHRKSEGAGLGLSIVKSVVTAHGGTIHLWSQPGQGSTFTLIFPLDPPVEVARYESSYSDR